MPPLSSRNFCPELTPDLLPSRNRMKLRHLLIALPVAFSFMASAHAQLKVGIVDMNEAFVSYYRTRQAEAKINAAREEAKTALDQRLENLNKAVEEINKLQQELQRPELSETLRESKARELNEKANDTRALDREVAEFRMSRERQIQEQFVRMRTELIEDIMKVVNAKIREGGYDLVFDKSGLGMGQVPVVLHSREDMDFTKAVIEELNKSAPKDQPAQQNQQKR